MAQEEQPTCKKLSDKVLVWLSARCRLFAYGAANANAIRTPPQPDNPHHLLPHLNQDFQVLAYPGCPGKETVKQVSL